MSLISVVMLCAEALLSSQNILKPECYQHLWAQNIIPSQVFIVTYFLLILFVYLDILPSNYSFSINVRG